MNVRLNPESNQLFVSVLSSLQNLTLNFLMNVMNKAKT